MKTCEQCGKEFEPRRGKANRFCSLGCYWKSKVGIPAVNMEGLKLGHGWNKGQSAEWAKGDKNANWKGGKITLVCQDCGNEYETWQYLQDTSRYCSRECSLKHTNVGTREVWNKGKHPKSNGVLENYVRQHGAWNKGKAWLKMRGENHPNWNGGSSKDNNRNWGGAEYKEWHKAVLERDDYTCQICNVRGGQLEVHHIKSWARHKELRYSVSNGLTVHPECHAKIDKFRNARMKKR